MFKNVWKIDPAFFDENKSEINKENKVQFAKLASTGGRVAAALFLIAIICPDIGLGAPAYLFIFLTNLLGYLLANRLKEDSKLVLPLFYSYITVCFAFAIFRTFFSETPAKAVFCVFLVILPTFIVDRQWKMQCYLLGITLAYMLIGRIYAPRLLTAAQLVECITFYIISAAAYSYNLGLRIRNIENRQVLTKKVEIDSLTQLYNRSALEKRIMSYIAEEEEAAAFILIDVDNFKGINDNFGHATGDELLYQTAAILKEQFRHSDYIGRLGGDEFVIFLPRVSDKQWLNNKMQALVEEMDRTFIGDAAICKVSGSVGIAVYPEHGRDFEELYKNADEAMYEAKKSGKNRFYIYE